MYEPQTLDKNFKTKNCLIVRQWFHTRRVLIPFLTCPCIYTLIFFKTIFSYKAQANLKPHKPLYSPLNIETIYSKEFISDCLYANTKQNGPVHVFVQFTYLAWISSFSNNWAGSLFSNLKRVKNEPITYNYMYTMATDSWEGNKGDGEDLGEHQVRGKGSPDVEGTRCCPTCLLGVKGMCVCVHV